MPDGSAVVAAGLDVTLGTTTTVVGRGVAGAVAFGVGPGVGDTVGRGVGNTVGRGVGNTVGRGVGNTVGRGEAVGEAVTITVPRNPWMEHSYEKVPGVLNTVVKDSPDAKVPLAAKPPFRGVTS